MQVAGGQEGSQRAGYVTLRATWGSGNRTISGR